MDKWLARAANYLKSSRNSLVARGKLPKLSRLDEEVLQALAKRAEDGRQLPSSFDTFVIKFPTIAKQLRRVRQAFNKYDRDNSHTIDIKELESCFRDLNVLESPAELREYFTEADVDGNHTIDFVEFILALCLLYLTKPVQEELSPQIGAEGVEDAFESIVDAFLYFDTDCNGLLSQKEVHEGFAGHEPGKRKKEGRHVKEVAQRFAEMDYDENGQCSFKEFLLAFVDWVGISEEEEDEEEEDEEEGAEGAKENP